MTDKLITIDELIKMLGNYSHKELHVHHTWRPSHKNFTGSNYQKLQDGMRNYHVNTNKWSDIAQHVTLFPDGKFMTGRNFGQTPVSIKGYNTGGFCVEMIGDFDKGQDKFEGKQKEAMILLARYFYDKGRYIRFHRENAPKTCPGTSLDKTDFMNDVKNCNGKLSVDVVEHVAGVTLKKSNALGCGDKGSEVKALQENLNKLGYSVGKVDGAFGKLTDSAVKKFQKDKGLVADALVGKKTLAAIEKAIKELATPKPVVKPVTKPSTGATKQSVTPKPTSPAPVAPKKDELKYTRTLKVGMSGNDVKALQTALNKLKFNCGTPDGKYGSKTKDAVRRFQSVHLAHEVDGIAGKNTFKEINKQLNK